MVYFEFFIACKILTGERIFTTTQRWHFFPSKMLHNHFKELHDSKRRVLFEWKN